MHFFNPTRLASQSAQLYSIFTMEKMWIEDSKIEESMIDYKVVPWLEKALLIEI